MDTVSYSTIQSIYKRRSSCSADVLHVVTAWIHCPMLLSKIPDFGDQQSFGKCRLSVDQNHKIHYHSPVHTVIPRHGYHECFATSSISQGISLSDESSVALRLGSFDVPISSSGIREGNEPARRSTTTGLWRMRKSLRTRMDQLGLDGPREGQQEEEVRISMPRASYVACRHPAEYHRLRLPNLRQRHPASASSTPEGSSSTSVIPNVYIISFSSPSAGLST